MTPQTTILDETAQYFTSARQNLMAGAANLYKIQEEGLWKPKFDSYGDFLEDIGVSQGMASKLVQTFKFYVIDSGLSHAKLVGIDHEKLYLALRLPGDAEKKLASAQTLSRQELRQEINDPDDVCLHEEIVRICSKCHKRV